MPKPDQFGDIDAECTSLLPLPAEERHGLLFVHPDPDGTIDLDELLGAWFDGEFPTWHFDRLVPINHDAYDTACNWKLAMDAFGETYHFASLRKDTLFNSFHGNVQCYADDGHNHRMILCRRDIGEMRDRPEDEWDITVAGLPVYWLFPNTIIMPFARGFSEIVRDEDDVMAGSQQRAAHAGALDRIVVGRNGPALHHYHQTYARKLGRPVSTIVDAVTP